MCSGGFRLGAWDYLKWDNIQPIVKDEIDRIRKSGHLWWRRRRAFHFHHARSILPS